MAYWLLKTEPSTYSYSDLVRQKKAVGDGARNTIALRHIRSMKKGNLALVYHSGNEKAVVGIAEIASAIPTNFTKSRRSGMQVKLMPARYAFWRVGMSERLMRHGAPRHIPPAFGGIKLADNSWSGTSDPYPDARNDGSKLVVVDLAPQQSLEKSISLATIKSNQEFSSFGLVRLPRLSAMPVTGDAWKATISPSKR